MVVRGTHVIGIQEASVATTTMVSVVGVIQEGATVRLVDRGVVLVCRALRDVVRSVVAYWILGVEALVLSVVDMHSGLDEGGVAVAVLVVAQSAIVCPVQFLWDLLKSFLPLP